jgi:hypothetical protein
VSWETTKQKENYGKFKEENTMDEKKIISTIRKVLELSKNNPSANEAQAAALKAQKLMMKYHISVSQVEIEEENHDITEKRVNAGSG